MHPSTMIPLAFIQGIGPTELIIIFFVILLLFGAKKLPELAKGMGKAMNEFKRASKDIETEFKESLEAEPETKTTEKSGASDYSHSKPANNESN